MNSDEVVSDLKSEFGLECEDFLGSICDLCHQPFVCDYEMLSGYCDNCKIAKRFSSLLRKCRTIALAEFLVISKDEILKE